MSDATPVDASSELRRFAVKVVEAFVQAVDRQYAGASAGPDMLHKAAAAFSVSPLLAGMAEAAARNLPLDENDDPYQRLLVSPLAEIIQSGELSRDYLPNYFNFIHVVMGDAQATLAKGCAEIVAALRAQPFPPFSWDDFLDDPRAQVVLWSVLAKIAESFKRFEPRKDWLIKLMQHEHQAVSLSVSVFLLPKGKQEGASPRRPFGDEDFELMFAALFGPLKRLSQEEQQAFKTAFGKTADEVFAPLWRNLKAE